METRNPGSRLLCGFSAHPFFLWREKTWLKGLEEQLQKCIILFNENIICASKWVFFYFHSTMFAFHELVLPPLQPKFGQLILIVVIYFCLLKSLQQRPMIFLVSKSEKMKMYWNLEFNMRQKAEKPQRPLKAIPLSRFTLLGTAADLVH